MVKNTGPIRKASTTPNLIPFKTIAMTSSQQKGCPFVQLIIFHYARKLILASRLALGLHPRVKYLYRINLYKNFLQGCTALNSIVIVERLEVKVEALFQQH